jgi:mannose-6-phosphate isomerase-like protein (cupin superfamily)
MSYRSNIVKKPWGYEYLVYENEDVGLWFLHIDENQSTSMHCHPKKTTGLVVLDGTIELSFLADKRELNKLDKIMIRRGLFHSSKASSVGGAEIFEIETPKDKHDLVRLNDKYGRESKPYEGASFEEEKQNGLLWIEEPVLHSSNTYTLSNCSLLVETIDDISVINNKHDEDLIMFLRGGMVRKIDRVSYCVTIPGDVGKASIVKQVSHQLDGVISGTIILTIKQHDL